MENAIKSNVTIKHETEFANPHAKSEVQCNNVEISSEIYIKGEPSDISYPEQNQNDEKSSMPYIKCKNGFDLNGLNLCKKRKTISDEIGHEDDFTVVTVKQELKEVLCGYPIKSIYNVVIKEEPFDEDFNKEAKDPLDTTRLNGNTSERNPSIENDSISDLKTNIGYDGLSDSHKNKENAFFCNICNKKFASKYTFAKHSRRHTVYRPYVCEICKKGFTVESDLELHLSIHNGKRFVCEVCDKAFSRNSELKSHIPIHTNEYPYVCKICNEGFIRKSTLELHLKTHSSEKPFFCKGCNSSFVKHSHLLRHKLERGLLCL